MANPSSLVSYFLGNGMVLQIVRQVTLVLFTIQPTDLLCVISRQKTGVKRLRAILTSGGAITYLELLHFKQKMLACK
jgi:hypothetical protein